MGLHSCQQSRVVINHHNNLAWRVGLLLKRFHGCYQVVPTFLCISTNNHRNIKCCLCHYRYLSEETQIIVSLFCVVMSAAQRSKVVQYGMAVVTEWFLCFVLS